MNLEEGRPMSIGDRLTRVEIGQSYMRDDINDLKATVSRVGWIIVTAFILAILGTVLIKAV